MWSGHSVILSQENRIAFTLKGSGQYRRISSRMTWRSEKAKLWSHSIGEDSRITTLIQPLWSKVEREIWDKIFFLNFLVHHEKLPSQKAILYFRERLWLQDTCRYEWYKNNRKIIRNTRNVNDSLIELGLPGIIFYRDWLYYGSECKE